MSQGIYIQTLALNSARMVPIYYVLAQVWKKEGAHVYVYIHIRPPFSIHRVKEMFFLYTCMRTRACKQEKAFTKSTRTQAAAEVLPVRRENGFFPFFFFSFLFRSSRSRKRLEGGIGGGGGVYLRGVRFSARLMYIDKGYSWGRRIFLMPVPVHLQHVHESLCLRVMCKRDNDIGWWYFFCMEKHDNDALKMLTRPKSVFATVN